MSEENKPAQITQAELAALIGQINDLTKLVQAGAENKDNSVIENGTVRTKPVKRRNVTIMFLDGKPVVGMVNRGTDLNPVRIQEVVNPLDRNKTIMQADLIIRDLSTGKDEVIKNINWIEFLQEGERRECTVLKSRDEQWVIDQGTVMKKEVEEYRTVELNVEVPVEIQGTERHFIVDIGGKGVEIHEDWVNMAKASPKLEKTFVKTVD